MGLSTNLTAHWSLEEASGSRADDTASAQTLTDNNTVTQAAGIIGNAAQFTAANVEYLSRADNASLSTGDIDFAVAGWMYLDTLVNMVLAAKYEILGNQREYLLFYNHNDHVTNARFSFSVSNNGTALTTLDATNFGAPTTATWYFVVAWHDSVNNVIGISINAGTANTTAHTTGVFDSTATFAIGTLYNNASRVYPMNGRIDQVAFWKGHIPDATERTWLYNAGAGRTYAEIAAYETPAGRSRLLGKFF
jgi:hypothetical protein